MDRQRFIATLAAVTVTAGIFGATAFGDDTITAKGKVDDGIAEFVTSFTLGESEGHVLERNAVDLRFPEEGGDVEGTIEIRGREDVSRFAKRQCIARRTFKGQMKGNFDGDDSLEGTASGTTTDAPYRGCGGTRYARRKTSHSKFRWTATIEGRQLRGELVASGFEPVEFTANLSGVLGSEQGLEEALRGNDIKSARELVKKISGCRDGTYRDTRCSRALQYAFDGQDALSRIGSDLPSKGSLGKNIGTIGDAAYFAALRTEDGQVAFPLARAVLPVVVRLIMRSVRADDARSAARSANVAKRFLALVIRAELDSRK